MSTEYEWNKLRVRRDENGKWHYRHESLSEWLSLTSQSDLVPNLPLHAPIIAELDKLYPLPIEPPEPGTIVHVVGGTALRTVEMTFIAVEPDETDIWIVRDGDGELYRYMARDLALGPRPESGD